MKMEWKWCSKDEKVEGKEVKEVMVVVGEEAENLQIQVRVSKYSSACYFLHGSSGRSHAVNIMELVDC